MKSKQIKLGNKVRDIVTGYEGIATAKVEYLNGCVQYCVKPPAGKDGNMPEGAYLDEGQLTVVSAGVKVSTRDNGGPMPDEPNGIGLSKK
jgi:hypothetical protein